MTHTTPRSILALATACMLMAIAASSYAQAQRTSQVTDDAQATSSRTAPAPSSPKPFEDLDTNGDGAISKDEAAVDPPLAQAFGTQQYVKLREIAMHEACAQHAHDIADHRLEIRQRLFF